MKKLENKTAVITGGTSGIGLSIAKLFVKEGANVVVTGRKQEALNKAIKELGNTAIAIKADVSKLNEIEYLYKTVGEKFGKIDVLVANAGVYPLSPLSEFTEALFDHASDINFKGTFFTVQKSLQYLNDGASIILLSSTVNDKGIPGHSAYSATKAAVRSLVRSFSAELVDRKIRVNVLSPGLIETPIFNSISSSAEEAKAMAENMGNFTPVKRLGQPSEIATGALYLASDDSSFMLGAELLLDGGFKSL
ncbi:glucose 1-dehydrogenase [Rhizosphaericola mali]|uniref:Glucose 1-dehydrogenase n=1 Tax=Rhizosphaericola mali TaxID=2545455 RepID=A0A5P2G0G0_9BACT|nr:glucose 1-dehydrogenase [Rhizosphaericola mali]QES87300.1 glucose 1-dehydrogenase [Rhizosphaericola mali]